VQLDVFQRVVRQELQKLGDARGSSLREDRLSDFAPVPKAEAEERGPLEAPPVETHVEKDPIGTPGELPKPEYRVIGVVLNTYILIEADDSLVLIDQHAAHERLQYEKFMAQLESGRGSQQLLTPLILRLSAREIALIMDNLEPLREAGYDVEPFGETDIQVRAVPFILGKADLKPAFMDTVNALNRVRSATVELRRAEVMQMACKSAVKGGDPLSRDEIEALIRQMLETGAPPTCPHGRPVMKSLSRRELEKMFKRIQ
jgi:DNA mismatch repair protein MutL